MSTILEWQSPTRHRPPSWTAKFQKLGAHHVVLSPDLLSGEPLQVCTDTTYTCIEVLQV